MRLLRVEQQRNAALSPYVIEFLLLTAYRGSEVVGMQWSEVEFDNNLWIVPAERTKARREHRVPLPERAVELLAQQRKVSSNSYVWQTPRGEDSINNKALYRFLTKNMGVRATIHGFRSSFRDWAGNETHFDRVTCELALRTPGRRCDRACLSA